NVTATPEALELELKPPPVAVHVTPAPLVVAAMERVSPTVRAARLGETITVVAPEALIVYVAVATTLLVNPLAAAMALTVFVALTVIGTVNWAEDVVGVLPSVV